MPTGSIKVNASFGGFEVPSTVEIDQEMQVNLSQSIAAAKTGTLTTRTDDNTGTITGQSGHGITTASVFDAFWTNADGSVGCQRNIVAGTVSGTSIPFDSGIGDNMPAQDTALTICPQTSITGVSFEGDNVKMLLATCQGRFSLQLKEGSTVHATYRGSARSPFFWYDGAPFTNPIAGDLIDTILISNGDSSGAKDFKLVAALTS